MKMDNSEQSEKILDLGRLLVKELGLDPGVDTLGRWMAHYIAEKIHRVEKLPRGKKKAEAERECCDLILKIWEHRSQLPNGKRPFESFEPILKVLEGLDPDNDDPYLHQMSKHELAELERDHPNFETIRPYLESVVEIEKVARVWIESLLNQAALRVSDEKTHEWLRAAVQAPLPDDIRSIRIMLKKFDLSGDDDSDSSSRDADRLKKRIGELKKFKEVNQLLLKTYEDALESKSPEK
jgi:hypothetical protein